MYQVEMLTGYSCTGATVQLDETIPLS